MQHVSVCSITLLMSVCKTGALLELEAQKVCLYRPEAAHRRCPLLGRVCVLCLGHLQNGKCSVSSAFVMRSERTQHKPPVTDKPVLVYNVKGAFCF